MRAKGRTHIRRKSGSKLRYKNFYYMLFGTAGSIAAGLIIFGFVLAHENHKKQQQAFTLDNIEVRSKSLLTANFVERGVPQDFVFPFEIENHTDYDYKIRLQGEIIENGSKLPRTNVLELPAQGKTEVRLAVPLAFPEELEKNNLTYFSIKLDLSTEIAAQHILGSLFKDIEKRNPLGNETG